MSPRALVKSGKTLPLLHPWQDAVVVPTTGLIKESICILQQLPKACHRYRQLLRPPSSLSACTRLKKNLVGRDQEGTLEYTKCFTVGRVSCFLPPVLCTCSWHSLESLPALSSPAPCSVPHHAFWAEGSPGLAMLMNTSSFLISVLHEHRFLQNTFPHRLILPYRINYAYI